MNALKLLPCGRLIFYNLSAVAPHVASDSLTSVETLGGFSTPDSTDELEEDSAVHLGLSDVAISDKTSRGSGRARRGTHGITSHGRNSIRAGCHWLEERFGKKNLTFLTATLPNEALMECRPETWAIVVNRFLKALRYHLERVGLCSEIVGCIEIQGERLKDSSGVPPLHLHLLFQGRQPYAHWGLGKKFYQRLWGQTCRKVWHISALFEESCRVESIQISGVSYMSKYLSKGGDLLDKSNPDLLPSAWYTLSAKLKGIIKDSILYASSHLAEHLYEHFRNGELLKWSRHIWSVEHGNGSQYLIAWIGEIKGRGKFWEIHDEIKKLINTIDINKSREFTFNF